jgi:hypothetical protein
MPAYLRYRESTFTGPLRSLVSLRELPGSGVLAGIDLAALERFSVPSHINDSWVFSARLIAARFSTACL